MLIGTRQGLILIKMASVKLIVKADEPALFFSSIEAAEKYLEAIDIEKGVYPAAYGPEGERFQLNTNGNRVFITPSSGRLAEPDELRSVLLKFFSAIKKPVLKHESLEELLRKCEEHISA